MDGLDVSAEVIDWLCAGDVALAYQTHRDILGEDRPDLQARIAEEGWGARLLALRGADGHWGDGFYTPQWTGTHYTLVDLVDLGIVPTHKLVRKSIGNILATHKGKDGGILHAVDAHKSDVCINGQFLRYATYFGAEADPLVSIVDFLLDMVMVDGGFNCQKNRSGARHSSLHSTVSVLEGFSAYARNGYSYRLEEICTAIAAAQEFVLSHRLYRSDRTGEIIHPDFLKLRYPSRWRFNILRALDYFRCAELPYDDRMHDALVVLLSKQRKDGRWPRGDRLPGPLHFEMEPRHQPGRWVTLMAVRILKAYGPSMTDKHMV